VPDFIEWVPKHHGHQPLHWTPDMLTSVDGKSFVRQPNWAWIAGSVYYVPREAVELPRIEPDLVQTEQMTKRYAPKHEMLVAVMTSMGWVEVEEELQEYLEALEHCGLEIREKQP
jgi:hypothetical protein